MCSFKRTLILILMCSYLRTLKRIGWTLISGIDGEKGKKKLLVQATPNGMIFETEKDELRDADEVDRMDQFRKV